MRNGKKYYKPMLEIDIENRIEKLYEGDEVIFSQNFGDYFFNYLYADNKLYENIFEETNRVAKKNDIEILFNPNAIELRHSMEKSILDNFDEDDEPHKRLTKVRNLKKIIDIHKSSFVKFYPNVAYECLFEVSDMINPNHPDYELGCDYFYGWQKPFLSYLELIDTSPTYRDFKFMELIFAPDDSYFPYEGFERPYAPDDVQSCDEIESIRLSYEDYFTRNNASTKIYEVRDIHGVCITTLYYILKYNLNIKKCANCGRFFISYGRSDTLYCSRISPQDNNKTCCEYGSYKAWETNLKSNAALMLCRNIYMSKQMLCKRNPDIIAYKNNFEVFKKESAVWKSNLKNDKCSESEFIEWLNEQKQKKV